MEIGLLLGLTGRLAPAALRRDLPALALDALALLGTRDGEWRHALNVGSLAGAGALLYDEHAVAADIAGSGRAAAARDAANSDGWWLHTDVDVLAQSELRSPSCPATRVLQAA